MHALEIKPVRYVVEIRAVDAKGETVSARRALVPWELEEFKGVPLEMIKNVAGDLWDGLTEVIEGRAT